MTKFADWKAGRYPWDFARCGFCLAMHTNGYGALTCHDPTHEEMRQVINEQGFSGWVDARIEDHGQWANGDSAASNKWLNDNYERCVALRELFRDEYTYNPAPPEQTELPLEPAVVGTKV